MKITATQLRRIIKEEVQKATQAKPRLTEGHSRITQDELEQWTSGNWGFISEADGEQKLPSDYEACDTCGYDHGYDYPLLTKEELLIALEAHGMLRKD